MGIPENSMNGLWKFEIDLTVGKLIKNVAYRELIKAIMPSDALGVEKAEETCIHVYR
jgi:hypothetical protein